MEPVHVPVLQVPNWLHPREIKFDCVDDFVIVFFSLLEIALVDTNLAFIKIVRMLRILRPLRFISNNPSLKVLVNSLFESMAGLANVTIVICLIW